MNGAWSLFAPRSAKPYFAIALFQNRPKMWFFMFAPFQKCPKMWFFMFTLFQKCPKIWFYMIAPIMVCPHFFAQFLSLRNLIFSVMVCPKFVFALFVIALTIGLPHGIWYALFVMECHIIKVCPKFCLISMIIIKDTSGLELNWEIIDRFLSHFTIPWSFSKVLDFDG